MKDKFGRIGVLMGGPSTEREISLKSGRAVYQALKEQGLDVVPLEIKDKVKQRLKQAKIALAFIALHGKFGEDGTVQHILESLGIPYTGSGIKASRLALDKVASRALFQKYDIPVPAYEILHRHCRKKALDNLKLRFPLVVKPATQGSSIGISFVDRPQGLLRAVDHAFEYDKTIIIEEYIKGREITVGILEENPLPVLEIIPRRTFFDFSAKYQKGQSDYIVPVPLPRRVYRKAQEVGLSAHQALGCRAFSRVDMILSKDCPFVLEVNSIPGLTSTSLLPMAARARGIGFGKLCLKIVQSALRR